MIDPTGIFDPTGVIPGVPFLIFVNGHSTHPFCFVCKAAYVYSFRYFAKILQMLWKIMLKWVHKKYVTRGVNAFYVLGIGSTLIDPLVLVAPVDSFISFFIHVHIRKLQIFFKRF